MYEMKSSNSQNLKNLKDECEKLLFYQVILTMTDGNTLDEIIEKIDGDQIVVLVGEDIIDQSETTDTRQFVERRFNCRVFPLVGLAVLALVTYPYYRPYPY